jgi:hypothetical protein
MGHRRILIGLALAAALVSTAAALDPAMLQRDAVPAPSQPAPSQPAPCQPARSDAPSPGPSPDVSPIVEASPVATPSPETSPAAPVRPHAIWAAIRFTCREYSLMPFDRMREMGIGTIYPHFGRLRVTKQGRVELYDFYGKVLWPDQKSEMKKMVARLHAEGFRVVPWLSVKREKPEGSFWIYDDWTPLLETVRACVDEMGIDGFQLDPEPLNVCDVDALNQGLAWLAKVLDGREVGVAVPKLVPGTPAQESGFQWPDVAPYRALTHATTMQIMSYDTRCQNPAAYTKLLRDNLAVARALAGKTPVYMGLPCYPADPPPKPVRGKKKKPLHLPAHVMPPEDGRTFARALRDHPDTSALAGVAIYDLEEPEDKNWFAAWGLAQLGMETLFAPPTDQSNVSPAAGN